MANALLAASGLVAQHQDLPTGMGIGTIVIGRLHRLSLARCCCGPDGVLATTSVCSVP